MTHKLEQRIPLMVNILSVGDSGRAEACRRFLEHGDRQKRFARLYFTYYPNELPPYTTLDEIEFAFHVHDMVKGVCVTDLDVFNKRVETKPPYSEDTLEIIAHSPLGEQFFMDLEWADWPIPRVVYEVIGGHHGKLHSQGMATMTGNELGPIARLSGIIDQIVSRCEDRERRYNRKPLTFARSFDEVRESRDSGTGELQYDRRIADNIWEMFKDNPHINEVGFDWLY